MLGLHARLEGAVIAALGVTHRLTGVDQPSAALRLSWVRSITMCVGEGDWRGYPPAAALLLDLGVLEEAGGVAWPALLAARLLL